MNDTIFILGTIPPPIGGVSIYCFRRMAQLREEKKTYILFDTKKASSILQVFFCAAAHRLKKKNFVIEVHTSNPKAIFVLNFLGLLRFCEFIDHNSSRRFSGWFGRAQLRNIASKCSRVKMVNISLQAFYKAAGVENFVNFSFFSPYIRPSEEEIKEAFEMNRAALAPLLGVHDRNIVLSSAWKPVLHSDGRDLYGITNVLDIYEALLPVYPNIKFALMVGELDDSPLCALIRTKVSALETGYKNFYFITGGVSQLPILPLTIAFLRLTRTDGNSVGVRESLDFGCHVIATDVCARPPGVSIVNLDDNIQAKILLNRFLSSSRISI